MLPQIASNKQTFTINHKTITIMKKLVVLITILGTTWISADAQFRADNREFERNSNWRYDNDYRVSNNRKNTINSFQRDAREHIALGIVEGTITSREAARLLEMAERIEEKENRYMRRGGLDRREVAELKEDLRELDRRILSERRDSERISNQGHRSKDYRRNF